MVNRKLKYPLGCWDHDALKYWKWHFSEINNRLIARYRQVFKAYKISNRRSRRNKDNYVEIISICAKIPEDIKEVDIYNDWSYKI